MALATRATAKLISTKRAGDRLVLESGAAAPADGRRMAVGRKTDKIYLLRGHCEGLSPASQPVGRRHAIPTRHCQRLLPAA